MAMLHDTGADPVGHMTGLTLDILGNNALFAAKETPISKTILFHAI